jgi:hypothetical protein
MVSNTTIPKKYVPYFEELRPLKEYQKLNFPKNFKSLNYFEKYSSFKDLIKFNKIWIDKNMDKFVFMDQLIVPSEIGLTDIFIKNYFRLGLKDLFKDSVIKTSEEIANNIFIEKAHLQKSMKNLNMIISAFGWGIPYCKRIKNKVILEFAHPPITKYKPFFRAFILNGFLNQIYNKKFNIEEMNHKKIVFSY